MERWHDWMQQMPILRLQRLSAAYFSRLASLLMALQVC